MALLEHKYDTGNVPYFGVLQSSEILFSQLTPLSQFAATEKVEKKK